MSFDEVVFRLVGFGIFLSVALIAMAAPLSLAFLLFMLMRDMWRDRDL